MTRPPSPPRPSGPLCQPSIDVNADLGEAVSPERRTIEDLLIESVTSVNIACGGHAGNEASMRHAVRSAARHGVAVGAHPAYPDPASFGRVRMDLEPDALRATIAEQISVLASIARSEGVTLSHCKPHGALYHAASTDESVASAIRRACVEHDPDLRLIGQAGSRAVAWWSAMGARVSEEAFADRVYDADGSLRSRTEPGALITNPGSAAEQALRIATTRSVRCANGSDLALRADTVCVHSDTPTAAAIADRVIGTLRAAGVVVRALD